MRLRLHALKPNRQKQRKVVPVSLIIVKWLNYVKSVNAKLGNARHKKVK
ncbi:Uncharacterised protein [Vibrio cholerae]|nr:Uncharacterised protein [Vibrio cholerae]CSI76502.1 Uncharacterised protein [Vibrio cholerae]